MSNLPQWLLWASLSALFAALTAVFAKVGVKGVDSDLAMALRTLVVAIVLVPMVVVAGKWSSPFALPAGTQLFLVLSALATGASWLCYFRALQAGELAKVAVVDKFSVVLVIVFALVFLHERPAPREWAGIVLVVSGIGLLALGR